MDKSKITNLAIYVKKKGADMYAVKEYHKNGRFIGSTEFFDLESSVHFAKSCYDVTNPSGKIYVAEIFYDELGNINERILATNEDLLNWKTTAEV